MKVLITISTILASCFVVTGCYYDVEEELYPTLECDSNNISYMTDIVPILDTDCYSCHSASLNFGNVTLEGHEQLLKYVNDGSLLGTVQHEAGFSPMPKGRAKLLDCEIEKILRWVSDGALDN